MMEIDRLIERINTSAKSIDPIELAAILVDSELVAQQDLEFILDGENKTLAAKKLAAIKQQKNTGVYKIHLNEGGGYDAFPAAFFHSLNAYDKLIDGNHTIDRKQSKEAIQIDETNILKENAQAFFSPYEQVFYQYMVNLELYKRANSRSLVDCLSSFWNLPHWLKKRERKLFVTLLPLAKELRLKSTSLHILLPLITRHKVSIQTIANTIHQTAESLNCLGDTNLGNHSILGNTISSPNKNKLKITLQEVNLSSYFNYVSNVRASRVEQTYLYGLVQLALNFFLSIEQDFEISLKPAYKKATLTKEEGDTSPLLGYAYLLDEKKLN